MKPALSIVVFTVLSGGGLGLAAMLSVFADAATNMQFAAAAAVSAMLTGGGLLSSVFHLANPKNAWRAFSRVRTSWLSREAVFAVLFFALFFLWAALRLAEIDLGVLRAAVFVVAVCAVFCTAMIYQSLKPIAAWHHPLTSCCYLAFAMQSGALLFAVCISFGDAGENKIVIAAICFWTVAAVIAKVLYYWRLGKCEDVRVGRAAGFSRAQAKLLETGHAAQTFLTREFIFAISARKLLFLRIIALLLILVPPLLGAVFVLRGDSLLAIFSAALLFFGLLIERWLFFAEAKHAVRAYHGIGAP